MDSQTSTQATGLLKEKQSHLSQKFQSWQTLVYHKVSPWVNFHFIYLSLAFLLPWISMEQPPDAVGDYLPMRDHVKQFLTSPGEWITNNHAYRTPGYPLVLILISLISESETAIRIFHGLLLVLTLRSTQRLAKHYGANPWWASALMTVPAIHFVFAQLVLAETTAMFSLVRLSEHFLRTPNAMVARAWWGLVLVFTKPAMVITLPLLLFPRTWRQLLVPVLVATVIGAWGFVLKPKAGQWTLMGAGGGLNLFVATLPDNFKKSGADLDAYWIKETLSHGHPAKLGWYQFDKILKQKAIERFPDQWSWDWARWWSPFFGRQYHRGFTWSFLPFGLLMLTALALSIRHPGNLLSLVLGATIAVHLVMAPFARFIIPLLPLAAIIVSRRFFRHTPKTEWHIEETSSLSAPLRQWFDKRVSWINWRGPLATSELLAFETEHRISVIDRPHRIELIFAKLARGRPQIVHSHHPKSALLVYPLTWLWDGKTRWLHHIHGFTSVNWKDCAYNRIDTWLAGKCDTLILNCHHYQQKLASAPSVVIPDARRRSDFPDIRLPDINKITNPDLPWLAVGRLSPEKGHEWLIYHWPSSLNLIILGDGPLKSRLLDLTQNKPNIQLLGHQDPWPWYSRCAGLVHPSFQDATPNVITEAIWSGLPVVARNVGGIPEVLPPSLHSWLFRSESEMLSHIAKIRNDNQSAPSVIADQLVVAQRWVQGRSALWREQIWQETRASLGLPKLAPEHK